MSQSGGYNPTGGNNQDNSWLGCVFVAMIIGCILVMVGLRILVSC